MKAKSPQTSERDPIKCVILDVGGERYTAQRNSLLKYPTTRLGKLMRSATISGGQWSFIYTYCTLLYAILQAFWLCVMNLFLVTLLNISSIKILKTFQPYWKCIEGNLVKF